MEKDRSADRKAQTIRMHGSARPEPRVLLTQRAASRPEDGGTAAVILSFADAKRKARKQVGPFAGVAQRRV